MFNDRQTQNGPMNIQHIQHNPSAIYSESDDSKQGLNIFALKVLSLFKLKTNNLKNVDSLNSKSNHEKYNYKNPNDCY